MSNHPNPEKLQAYLDGELPVVEVSEIEAHVHSCSACTADLAALERLFATIESVPSEPLRTDLAPEVLDSIRPRLPSLVIGEFLLMAALTAVLVIGIGGAELESRVGRGLQELSTQLELARASDESARSL